MDGEISADELKALLDDEDVRVVDIRPRAAFERGHIPDSENIPFSELPQSVDRLDGADRVVTVCPHGQASQQAARLVQSYEGLDEDARVESLASGITGWDGEVVADENDEGPDTESPTESPF
ncbi:rhodanese-like domain-containing protein [Halobacterium noricense]|uniref:rhodanese-like domain-containing protein n=1 Tax=Halobacterium noricense TaxID=223182 RepID=UPI001E333EAD|nr:rhodanese-like domain-containing protein [Halobacterium noricense]UHH25228.1 rhodanese-like domain-containing protein [Halobacterium noricense]